MYLCKDVLHRLTYEHKNMLTSIHTQNTFIYENILIHIYRK
jgi:hypothetical protein